MRFKIVSVLGPLWVLLMMMMGGGEILPTLLIVTIPCLIFLSVVKLLHGDGHKEQGRQMIHIVFGVTLVFALNFIGKLPTLFGLLAFGLYLGTLAEVVRKGGYIPMISEGIESFERSEALPFKGAIEFCLGAMLTMLAFGVLQASVGILVLAFGDGFATVIGKLHGRHRIGEKSLEGTLAGLLASFLVCSLVLPWELALLASAVGMGIELASLPLDDNITIPLGVAIALTFAL